MTEVWTIDLIDRQTSAVAVADYAGGFETYAEARAWADKYELSFRACGWTAAVRQQ